MIDEKKLIKFIDVGTFRNPDELCFSENDVVRLIKNFAELSNELRLNEQPKTDWIPCEVEMPKEHDGYYSELIRMGLKNYSYDQCSDDVLVTVELNDGQIVIARSQTFDGEWEYEWRTIDVGHNKVKRVRNGHKVIAWQPLPQAYKKEGNSNENT